ncbi:hypothetical protein SH1V18_32460 [Vallitalea longa]|uniref:Uncharacterized protein n=1 Tax=Vallitalea longa TaxID=2936439 RepID=A0A9W6DF15_9FIRM|nr:Imm59 family immunity protein [Vallitalea longa]GKX30766.1 hypothetical protein SH1V18_32460 [Vallitalea longa]
MTREDVIRIIKDENLDNYNLNEDRYNRENEVGIRSENGYWTVYATDERASKVTGSEKKFEHEEQALDNFIKRLRASKVLRKFN